MYHLGLPFKEGSLIKRVAERGIKIMFITWFVFGADIMHTLIG